MSDYARTDGNEELWYTVFAEGHPVLVKKQTRFVRLPKEPRCKLCYAPFAGIGGWIMRLRGLKPSERNVHYCNACDGFLEAFPGGAEVPMTMLILDIRDSVPLSREMSAKDFAQTVNRMRDAVTETLNRHDGFVLEFQGDSVVCVWPPGFSGKDHAAKAIRAAGEAVKTAVKITGSEHSVPIGMGVHTGDVFIGTVSAAGGRMQGISAFGYDVNLVARLAAQAKSGEALVSAATYEAAGMTPPRGAARELELKGVEGMTTAYSVSASEREAVSAA